MTSDSRCLLLSPGEVVMNELCTCGSWDVRAWWIGGLCDVSTCRRCGRQWSASEEFEFGYRVGDPRWLVDMPAVNAKQFLPTAAQAAGEAAQWLDLVRRDCRAAKKERK